MAETGQRIITDNLIQPFQMAKTGVRGRVVRMGSVVDAILERHGYPDVVARFLGEALVLAAMLGGALKFDGIFTVQTKGDGAISMIAADMTTPGNLRGYASFEPSLIAKRADEGRAGDVASYLGSGYIAFTIDAGSDRRRYQGIVELAGDSLAECMENYFDRSEQIETKLCVAVDKVNGKWRAGGLMIQRLPDESAAEIQRDLAEENWRNAEALVGTLTAAELTSDILKSPELLYRLFHEDGVWLYEPQELVDHCTCNLDRVMATLRTFSAADLHDMAVDGTITVDCQFCSSQYRIRPGDIA